jgi:hypothetical protein
VRVGIPFFAIVVIAKIVVGIAVQKCRTRRHARLPPNAASYKLFVF